MNNGSIRQMIAESILRNTNFSRIAGPERHTLAASVADNIMSDFGIEVAQASIETAPDGQVRDLQVKSEYEESAVKSKLAHFIAENKRLAEKVESYEPIVKYDIESALGGNTGNYPDEESIGWQDDMPIPLTFGDLRRAKAALEV